MLHYIDENSVEYIEKLLEIWNNNDFAVLIDYQIPVLTAIDMMNEAQVEIEKHFPTCCRSNLYSLIWYKQ